MTTPTRAEPARLYRQLAVAATVLAVGLITLGGVVRITGSGMGCGDHWPLCNGRLLPNLADPLEVIEWSHRWVAALLSASVLALTWAALRYHARDGRLRNPALLATGLLVLQVVLGAVTVKLDTAAPAVVIHLGNAMVLLAVLMVCVLRSEPAPGAEGPIPGPGAGDATRTSMLAAGLGFLTILLGALVANYNAGLYCLGFPLCGGALAPPPNALGRMQWIHRVLAFTLLLSALAVAARARTLEAPGFRRFRQAAFSVPLLIGAQIAVGTAMVFRLLPTSLRALHLLVGSLVWLSLVILVYRSRRAARAMAPVAGGDPAMAPTLTQDPPSGPTPGLAADLVTLTKPRIISLLLLTTVAPMFITPAGLPSAWLVLWVVIGGYLMAGGANTINMWFDRDIDCLMARTRLRPIPSGRIHAGLALLFGLAQAAAAFAIFWRLVNPLSAWLALGGLLFYVLVYTMWLKRTSPQNIVIGGAAGAFPPLVGWTAMTGHLDLAALYLFAIVFFWTPPHFWALALVKQQDYARAGIPMMPVVAGERWTKVQMLAYTLMLIPLTVMPSVFGALGLFYAAVAIGLGGRLLWFSVRVLRDRSLTPMAWRMYKYSLLYLALLFVAMGVDRALPFGHRFERAPILILDHPETEAIAPAPR